MEGKHPRFQQIYKPNVKANHAGPNYATLKEDIPKAQVFLIRHATTL